MMMSEREPEIRLRVDPTNPGQFFACCGLLELADRQWFGVEAWFDRGLFYISSEEHAASLQELLTIAHDIRLADDLRTDKKDEIEEDEKSDADVFPLIIESPISLRLDWWRDKTLKPWAGSMDERKILLAMCNAIDVRNEDPLNQGEIVFDAVTKISTDPSGKRPLKAKKREPFYFDSRRGANALSIDVGFSPDSLKLATIAYPSVEGLSFIGLQRCRPKLTDSSRVFEYFTWSSPLPVQVVPLAILGLVSHGRGYRFENAFRTDQKKHKAFTPATSIGGY
jgi:CRISPR-associated protein Csb3